MDVREPRPPTFTVSEPRGCKMKSVPLSRGDILVVKSWDVDKDVVDALRKMFQPEDNIKVLGMGPEDDAFALKVGPEDTIVISSDCWNDSDLETVKAAIVKATGCKNVVLVPAGVDAVTVRKE